MNKKIIMITVAAVAVFAVVGSVGFYHATKAGLISEPVTPVAQVQVKDRAMTDLGKMLWYDPRLSVAGDVSCDSCHGLHSAGVDNLKTSYGHKRQLGPVNSPTVYNADNQIAQFWDGRAKDLQAQAAGPITNPVEMANTEEGAVRAIAAIPGYEAYFKAAFGDSRVTFDRITRAIAAFESTLVTPDGRFDLWLKGDKKALTETELSGYKTFKRIRCTFCHSGEKLGGDVYKKMGREKPYVTDNPSVGRMAVTGKESDRFVFKVPMLRNVALTAPYFHDGAVNSLEEAVRIMADVQNSRALSEKEVSEITAFLKTLTGKMPAIQKPALPQ